MACSLGHVNLFAMVCNLFAMVCNLFILAATLQDRQETAEKMASDLAEELKALQIQKDALEQRNQQLEAALQQSNDKQMATPVEAPQISNEVSPYLLKIHQR